MYTWTRRLATYAYEEVSRAYGVYKDLQEFKDTLSIIRGLLLDAEYQKDQKHGLREWMRQLQNICYDAEDVFDGFEFQHKRKQVVQASNSTRTKHCWYILCCYLQSITRKFKTMFKNKLHVEWNHALSSYARQTWKLPSPMQAITRFSGTACA